MQLSIIVPIYNEAGNISQFYEEVKAILSTQNWEYELIFVNDGSNDDSKEILKGISKRDKLVRVISFGRNYGQTSAIDAGIKNSNGRLVVTIDGDLQYTPSDLPKLVVLLDRNEVDIVVAKVKNKKSGFIKALSSKIGRFTRRLILRDKLQGSSFAGYKRRCLKGMTLYETFHVFLPLLLQEKGYNIQEVEIEVYPRRHGNSKYNIRKRAWKYLIALFVIKWLKTNKLRYQITECD